MIDKFKGEYSWLSNFQLLQTPIVVDEIKYLSTEHFYQAMKTHDNDTRIFISNHPLKGLKSFCRTIPVRGDWDSVKIDVMTWANEFKYSVRNPILRNKLISTGDEFIQEGNWWGDLFWGVDIKTGLGENNLGKIIMKIRSEINGKTFYVG